MGTERCLVGALSLNVLVRAELDRFFGASALIGITVAVLLLRGRHPAPAHVRIRRVAWMSVGGLTILTVLAVTAFGVSGASARTELSRGQQLATDGIAELGRGNFAEAAAKFTEAADSFSGASRQLDRPWARPARVVPVVAQNADAVTDLAAAAADSTTQLGTSLAQIDPDTLRIVGGRVDLAAIEAVAGPLQDVQASLDDLDAVVVATDSPWLLTPVRTRIDRLADDIDAQRAASRQRRHGRRSWHPQMLGRRRTAALPVHLHHAGRGTRAWAGSWATSPRSKRSTDSSP